MLFLSEIAKTFSKSKYVHRSFLILALCGILNIGTSTLSAEDLHAQPRTIVFNAVEGHAVSDIRSVFIGTTNGIVPGWSQTTNAPWLLPDLGSSSTDSVLNISVNTSGLHSGIYTGYITINAPQTTNGQVIINATLIINPDVPVKIVPWKDGRDGAMSVSVDDSKGSGFDELQANGFKGTYVLENIYPPSFYTDYYNAGMELGAHTVHHDCFSDPDDVFKTQEIEPNIAALCTKTPEPCKDIITLAWPCGYTNYREQDDATDYFLAARGYNINQLEDPYPQNFMNLKGYNSHEHYPYPPSDLKTVVDLAVTQKKWFNLVLHDNTNDDGAINYSSSKNIWVAPIGTIVKYILQREGFILTDYNANTNGISYKVSRLEIPASSYRAFENAFSSNDVITMQIDVDDSKVIENVLIDGVANPYQIKDTGGNLVLLTNIKPDPAIIRTVEIKYQVNGINLTISGVTANNKVYNATTSAVLNTSGATLAGVIAGDDVTLSTTSALGYFTNKNVGTGKTVITSGFTLTGNDAGKYSVTQPTTTASITSVSLTVSGVTANNKVYNASNAATLNTGSATLNGVLGGDLVSPVSTGATGIFADKNVGTAKPVSISGLTLGGTDSGNYTLTQPSATAAITQAPLTVSGVTANNKTYDGTTAATLNTGSATLAGRLGSDVVTLNSAGASGVFDNPNVGTGKTVYISGFTTGGTDAVNYTLTQPTATANIIGLALTITGVTANNRVYNGTTAATLNTGSAALVGVLAGDAVTLVSSGATGTFANKNTGIARTVTTTGFTLTGPDAAKYSLTQPETSASITAAQLTVSGVTANNKVYDGTTAATLNTGGATLNGIFGTDVVSLVSTGATGIFSDKNAGTSKPVSITGLTPGGTDSGNYTLTQPSTTARITPAPLTVSGVTAHNKVYDGTTAATINTGSAALAGRLGSDAVTLNTAGASGVFNNPDAGNGKTVLITGFTTGGTDAGNYTLTQPTATANITPIALTVTGVTANNRIYNGTTAATLNTGSAILGGVLSGDAVTLVSGGATGTFENKNTGTAKTVTASGFTLAGSDAANYLLAQPTTSASITAAQLTVSDVTANNKVYDGTTAATLNTGSAKLNGVFGTDSVSLVSTGATGTFADRNIGTAKTVSILGFTLAGTDSGNYTLIQPSATARITPASLTVSGVTANNKIYDGTAAATINTGSINLLGVIGTEAVSIITTGAGGNFTNKNAGIAKSVSTSGFTLGGADAANYTLTQPVTTADIAKASLTISGVTANNKVYNGTASATLNSSGASLTGVFGGDVVTLISTGATGIFADKDIGTAKEVSTSGFTPGGTDSGNYNLQQPATTGNITPAPLTISGIKVNNKVYDGTTEASLNTGSAILTGVYGSDAVSADYAGTAGTFADKNAGTHKTVLISGITLAGDDKSDYFLTQLSLSADITAKTLTVTANDIYKAFRTTYIFSGEEYTAEGLLAGDTPPVFEISSPGADVAAVIGTYSITISGGSDNNYHIVYVNGLMTIGKSQLIVRADDQTKVYGSGNPELTITYSGFIKGDDPSVIDTPPVVSTTATASSDAGNYTISVEDGADDIYDFIYEQGTLAITKADQIINFEKIPANLRITRQYNMIATASSGLPVTFVSSDPGKVSINGNILTVHSEGNFSISARQEGDNNWNPANDVIQSVETLPTFDNISSLFTPNADGMNDYWYISNLEKYGKMQVTVYNRYGQVVFKSDGYKNDWDGTWNGNPLPSAAYYYIIKSSTKGFIKGVVNIVR